MPITKFCDGDLKGFLTRVFAESLALHLLNAPRLPPVSPKAEFSLADNSNRLVCGPFSPALR
jgi:hypothetical protein